VGRALRPRRRAQPGVERGAADSRRPGVARLPGEALLPILFDFVVFRACSSRRDAYWFWSVGSRSSSTALATSMAPSTG
jgi:hypothetical protein